MHRETYRPNESVCATLSHRHNLRSYVLNMQSIRLFCNVRIYTNGVSALSAVPYDMCFVLKHVRELWCVHFLSFWCCCLVSN